MKCTHIKTVGVLDAYFRSPIGEIFQQNREQNSMRDHNKTSLRSITQLNRPFTNQLTPTHAFTPFLIFPIAFQ